MKAEVKPEKRVCIEYQNLPMKVAFQEEELRKSVASLFSRTPEAFKRLSCSNRTFRQYMCLGGEKELVCEISDNIYALMEAADRRKSYPMTKAYPYLLEKEWVLEREEISYMQLEVTYRQKTYNVVERIVKTEAMQMIFYPDEILYQVENERQVQQIMKEILLNGRVNLDVIF